VTNFKKVIISNINKLYGDKGNKNESEIILEYKIKKKIVDILEICLD